MPDRARTWLRVALAAVPLAAIVTEIAGGDPLARNLVLDAGLLAILGFAGMWRGRVLDLPFPRSRPIAMALPAAVALVAAWPAIKVPYLADDYVLLDWFGRRSSPFESLAPIPAFAFFRPAAWVLFWVYAHLSPYDGTLEHVVAVGLFALDAALVVPALRRCGAPRGIAVAAAVLFAASPVGLDTVAWGVNLYSLLGACGLLGALAFLPFRRTGWRAMAAPVGFASLAFLSKEDTFLLPAMVFCAGARFRIEFFGRGLRLAGPFAAALVAAIALRLALLGGMGGYFDPLTHRSTLWRLDRALLEALRTECPANYVLPIRGFSPEGDKTIGLALLALVPATLLALGGASRAAARGLVRGLVLGVLGLAATASLLPVGRGHAGVRLLFLPSVGISWIVASLASGAPAGRAGRWALVAGVAGLALIAGRRSLEFWRVFAATLDEVAAATTPEIRTLPPNARILVRGLPEGVFSVALPRLARRPDVEALVAMHAFGELATILELDPVTHRIRGSDSSPTPRALRPGETLAIDVTHGSEGRRLVRMDSMFTGEGPDGVWYLRALGFESCLFLPWWSAPVGSEITVRVDGDATDADGKPVPIPVVATIRRGERIERVHLAEGRGIVPPGCTAIRLELMPLLGADVNMRSLHVHVTPP